MKKSWTRLILFASIITFIIIFFSYDLAQYLRLEFLKSKLGDFNVFYSENTALTIATFALVYILVTACSLPGATILTLLAGALFGTLVGTIIVSFASTLGASIAFLVSRFLLRDWVQKSFGDKLSAINNGISREGGFYLFTLRLIPLFPFFVINLVMGLTPLKLVSFFWVSQLGMLPGTIVYVNAGTQLGQLQSLEGILDGGLILSFVLLGLFPLAAKQVLAAIKRKRAFGKYRSPKNCDYNVVVIGAGSGGLVASYICSAIRAKVALIEKHRMGGDCLNTGCVPSKALIKSAKILSYAKRASEFGFSKAHFDFEFSEVMERIQSVIRKVAPHDSIERYTQLGVDCYQGTAKILTPFEVEVGGKTLTTRNIIVATGGSPAIPSLPGIERVGYFTSDTIWGLRKLPKRMLVLGGGPIGCELAQCFQRFGSSVVQVQSGPRILPREDDEIADLIMSQFRKESVELLVHHKAKQFIVEGSKKILICDHQGKDKRIEFDEMLVAVGRRANTHGFGLEELGVRISPHGTIEADELLRTNYPNIYVCGDVVGPYQFTHFASHQAWYAAVNALFSPLWSFRADYRIIPWVTFTDPEVARVGLNEKEAKQKGIAFEVSCYGIEDLDRAIADGEDHGIVKVLTVPGKDKILGVTVVGDHAGDYFVEFVAAMKHGFGLNKILGTIHTYPTLAEANKYAAGVWRKTHAPEKALRLLKKFHAWRRGQSGMSNNRGIQDDQRRAAVV